MAPEATVAEIVGVLHRAWGERSEQVCPTRTLATCLLRDLSPVGAGKMESNSPVPRSALRRNPTRTWIRTQVSTQMRIQVRTLEKT